MSRPDPDTTVRRFIDGDLSEDEVQAALHRIADDSEARALLQFEVQMTQELAASPSPHPPTGFAADTVAQLPADASSSLRSRAQAWWRAVTQPLGTLPVRPVYALAFVLLLGALAGLPWFTTPSDAPSPPSSPTSAQPAATSTAEREADKVWTRFVYTDNDASSVAVAGDFSQWDPIDLSPRRVNGKTIWTGLVPVPRGEHEYQFVIDGEKWVTDPLAPVTQDDGFGAKNAVLQL
jgi:hypothetical protein